MSVPQPPVELEGHCAAINADTLYFLSPHGFQSLPLKEHAQWSKETNGVPVTGPACVTTGDGPQSALWVIGGTSSDGSFGGLQRYSFADKSWETIPTPVQVMQDRTHHSAAYLQDSQSILVYAGSQPSAPSYLSSQTFVISTQSPYTIQAYTSEAPTTNLPILEAWNTSHAVMLGGSELNTQIFTFAPSDGWQPLDTNITAPLDPSARGNIIDGSDGSKVLEVYEMSKSPNQVSQIVLLDAGGQTAATGQTIGSGSSSRKRKRDLSLQNWPAYNSTNAPTATRPDCTVAQGPSGVAVIAGGSSAAPVALFNQNDNSWVDADNFFDSKNQQPLKATGSSHVSASTASPTTTGPATSNAPASSSGSQSAHDRMLRTLGITLGVLCGIAAIFILVLLFLRWRKQKRRKQEGYLDEKTNDGTRMSFQDRGASFMKEAGGSVNELQPPNKNFNDSQNNSHSSLAIMTGKFASRRSANGHEPKASYDSTTRLVKNKNGYPILGENVEMMDIGDKKMVVERKPVPRDEPKPPAAQYGPMLSAQDAEKDARDRRKRSSGWSKYFATSQPTGADGLSHLPSVYVKPNTVSDGSSYSTDRVPSQPSRIPSSALVPPLDIDFSKTVDGQRLSHVTMGSPAFNDSREDLRSHGSGLAPEGQRGLIVDPSRPRSGSDSISSYNRSTMSSGMTSDYYNESGMTPWTPTSATFKDHLNSRPPSSVYESRVPSRGKSAGFFPGSGTSYRPAPKSKIGHSAASSSASAGLNVPSAKADDRDSNVTVFPKGVPSAYYAGREREQSKRAKPVNSDLGWLNLGLNGSQTRI